MISGLSAYTLMHVALSLIGILSGLIVAFGMLASKRLDGLNAIFPATTVLTSYSRDLAGAWRGTNVVTAMIALYLNCFVLVVQLFEKVPALHALDPTHSGPPFKHTQLVVLVLFVVLTIAATLKFRIAPTVHTA